MPLHPQVIELMARRAELGYPDNSEVTPAEARANAAAGRMAIPSEKEPVGEKTERTIPGPTGDIPIRVYRPNTEGPHSLIMLFHGGGWVVGDLDAEDSTSRGLVNRVDADFQLKRRGHAVTRLIAAALWVLPVRMEVDETRRDHQA